MMASKLREHSSLLTAVGLLKLMVKTENRVNTCYNSWLVVIYTYLGKFLIIVPKLKSEPKVPAFLQLELRYGILCLPWWLSCKVSACNAGDVGSIPESGRSPGGGHGNPLQYCCLENPKDRGAWWATVHRVTESDTKKWVITYTWDLGSATQMHLSETFLKKRGTWGHLRKWEPHFVGHRAEVLGFWEQRCLQDWVPAAEWCWWRWRWLWQQHCYRQGMWVETSSSRLVLEAESWGQFSSPLSSYSRELPLFSA